MLANRFMDTAPPAPGIVRAAEAVRAACAPANLLLAAAIVLGWLALIAWTGAGPDSWQARLCTNLDGSVPACGGLGTAKDPSRVAPHLATGRIAS